MASQQWVIDSATPERGGDVHLAICPEHAHLAEQSSAVREYSRAMSEIQGISDAGGRIDEQIDRGRGEVGAGSRPGPRWRRWRSRPPFVVALTSRGSHRSGVLRDDIACAHAYLSVPCIAVLDGVGHGNLGNRDPLARLLRDPQKPL